MEFNATKEEYLLIDAICDTPQVKQLMSGGQYKRVDLIMDLEACHSNGCPLDFNKLLFAADFDRQHDIVGIRTNINRKTGKLENCFVPRCARREAP